MSAEPDDDSAKESESSDEDYDSDDNYSSEEENSPEKDPNRARELWKFALKRQSTGSLAATLQNRLQNQARTPASNLGEQNRRQSLPTNSGEQNRRLSLPTNGAPSTSVQRGSLRRASATGQASDILKSLEERRAAEAHRSSLVSLDPKEALSHIEATETQIGTEWIAKVQALDDVREKAKNFNDQMLLIFEASGFDVSDLAPRDKIALNENLRNSIENLLQCVSKSAYESVRNDYEDLTTLRKVVSEWDDKVADMNTTYLKEVSMTRDRHRTPHEVVQEVAAKFDYDAPQEGSQHVEFYEPLKYLSEATRGICLSILDEKIKAMFSYDPTLRDRVNDFEIARFEDSMKDERLRSFERLNSRLRDENRDFRDQINKLEKKMEKSNWELIQVQKQHRQIEGDMNSMTQRGDMVLKSEAETQYENPEDLLTLHPLKKSSPSKTPIGSQVPSMTFRGMARTCEMGVQADMDRPSPGGGTQSARPSLHRKTSFECAVEKDKIETTGAKADLEIELNKLRRDFDKAKQILLQRDKAIKRLEQELEEAKAKISSVAPESSSGYPQVRSGSKERPSRSGSKERVPLSTRCDTLGSIASREPSLEMSELMDEMKLQEKLLTAQERALQEADKAAEAMQQVELLKDQARTLRQERDQAKAEALKAETRQVQIISACNSGSAAQELSAEVATSVEEKKALVEELDQLKGAFSMALSRNAALEVLVACRSDAPKTPKLGKRRTLESLASDRASEIKESRELENLHSQRGELREKVTIQKEQLSELVKENTTLHLALEEMAQEVKSLTEHLRKVVPDIEVMNADLEATLNKMDKVVKNGGGAYVRLHKDHRLREIAHEIRTRPPDAISDEDLRSNQTQAKAATSMVLAKAKEEGKYAPGESQSPRARENVAREPPPPPGVGGLSPGARRSTQQPLQQRPTCDDLSVGTAAAVCSAMSPRVRPGNLPSLSMAGGGHRRSLTSSDLDEKNHKMTSPRLAPLSSPDDRGTGSLVLGSKGGMAVLGGLGKAMWSGRG